MQHRGMAKEVRYDKHGELRLMAEAEGYVMVRRKRCSPFVLSRKEWDAIEFRSGSESVSGAT